LTQAQAHACTNTTTVPKQTVQQPGTEPAPLDSFSSAMVAVAVAVVAVTVAVVAVTVAVVAVTVAVVLVDVVDVAVAVVAVRVAESQTNSTE